MSLRQYVQLRRGQVGIFDGIYTPAGTQIPGRQAINPRPATYPVGWEPSTGESPYYFLRGASLRLWEPGAYT